MMKDKPFIYICSPLRGDIERNIQRAVGYSRFVFGMGGVPWLPTLSLPRFWMTIFPRSVKPGLSWACS